MPELVVIGAIVGLMILVIALFARPIDRTPARNNAARWVGVAQVMQLLGMYVRDYGSLPVGLTPAPQLIGSEKGMVNLCPYFVPTYVADVPLDPEAGGETGATCRAKDGVYETGYTITKTAENLVTVAAPSAEAKEKIELSKQF